MPEASGRIPPHNLGLERQLLSAFMVQPFDTSKACAGILHSRDFYKPAHGIIYEVVQEMIDSGARPDMELVVEALRERGQLKAVGGVAGVAEATGTLDGYASSAPAYVEKLSGLARNRDLIAVAGSIAELGYLGAEAAQSAFQAQRLVQEVVDATNRRVHLRSMEEMVDDYVAVLEEREQGRGLGLSTGWFELDAIIEGMREGELIIVGAPPKTGKSTFAANLVRHVIHEGHRVLLVSVEMAETEVMERHFAAEAGIDLSRLRTGQLGNDGWAKIGNAAAALADKPLTILDDPLATMAEVRACAMRTRAELVVIDYTQLMKAEVHKGGTREQVVAELTASMKRLARELRIPVVALSQVKREVSDGRPGLTDFAESSSFEKNANVLIGLYREGAQDEHFNARSTIIEVIVIASRNTKTGTARLAYNGSFQRISNMAQMADAGPRYN
jgi:replicative DNA helicase